jgi:hypothetical protein
MPWYVKTRSCRLDIATNESSNERLPIESPARATAAALVPWYVRQAQKERSESAPKAVCALLPPEALLLSNACRLHTRGCLSQQPLALVHLGLCTAVVVSIVRSSLTTTRVTRYARYVCHVRCGSLSAACRKVANGQSGVLLTERSAAMGEMRGDPGGSPGRLGYWEYGRGKWGTMRIHVGRSAAHV